MSETHVSPAVAVVLANRIVRMVASAGGFDASRISIVLNGDGMPSVRGLCVTEADLALGAVADAVLEAVGFSMGVTEFGSVGELDLNDPRSSGGIH